MSGAPPGRGAPYGMPPGRGNGNAGWQQEPPRPYGGDTGQSSSQQQRRPLQSESERRYVERTVQQLPEAFRTRPAPDYEEDMHDYRHASPQMHLPRGPPWVNSAPRSQSNFQPPHRQANQNARPRGPWPARGESAANNNGSARGAPGQSRDRVPLRQHQQLPRRPDDMAPPQHVPVPGPRQRGPAPVAYADYPGPADAATRSPLQQISNSVRGPDHWDEELLAPPTPNANRPITESSIYSQDSSGSIPDFPMPHGQEEPLQPPPPLFPGQRDSGRQMPMRIPLGPPPSSRRGPSSYYSQSSFVAPIVEEPGSGSRGSNDSRVIPQHLDEYMSDDDMQDGRTSRAEDHDDSTGLVRQASMGKKAKPAVVPVIKEPRSHVAKRGVVAQAVTSAGAAGGMVAAGLGASDSATGDNMPQSFRAPPALDAADSDASSSTFDEKARDAKLEQGGFRREAMASMDFFGGGPTLPIPRTQSPVLRSGSPFYPRSSSPLATSTQSMRDSDYRSRDSPNDSKVASIMVGLEKGGSIHREATLGLRSPRAGFGDKVGLKRPPRLNVDAVKDAEARGSLTSLPDLIKRATRLASNLDRGKTASRLGLEWFTADPAAAQFEKTGEHRRSATLSAILASFPPPGLVTPTGDRGRSRDTNATGWPQFMPEPRSKRPRRDAQRRLASEKPPRRPERRCCGMPLWAFILLAIVLLAIVVAAVVIPIAVVVLPKQKAGNDADSALAACQSKSPCKNGGSSMLAANGTCSCLCTNGFTGSSCSIASDAACSSMAVAGHSDATVGSAIPRLFDAAQSNYSIPLDSARVLAQFNAADVSCNTENALVTLNGQQSRRAARRSINNMFVPLQHASNPFMRHGSKPSAAPVAAPADQVEFLEADLVGWDDGQGSNMPRPTPAATLERRASSADESFLTASFVSGGGETVNGIIIATGSPTNAPRKSTSTSAGGLVTASGSPTVTQAASTGTATGTTGGSTGTTGEETQDFARVVILFVLQETGSLSDASDAQDRLSTLFSSGAGASSSAQDVDLGNSAWTVDLVDFRVRVANGTHFGGRSST